MRSKRTRTGSRARGRLARCGDHGEPTPLASDNDVVPPEIVAARERAATVEPIEVRESRRVGVYVVTVSARGYPVQPRTE